MIARRRISWTYASATFIRETCISVSEMRSRTIPPQAEGILGPGLEVGVYTPLRGSYLPRDSYP